MRVVPCRVGGRWLESLCRLMWRLALNAPRAKLVARSEVGRIIMQMGRRRITWNIRGEPLGKSSPARLRATASLSGGAEAPKSRFDRWHRRRRWRPPAWRVFCSAWRQRPEWWNKCLIHMQIRRLVQLSANAARPRQAGARGQSMSTRRGKQHWSWPKEPSLASQLPVRAWRLERALLGTAPLASALGAENSTPALARRGNQPGTSGLKWRRGPPGQLTSDRDD